MSSPEIFCGVDLGSQKTVVVASDGERILTSTGGTSRPTAVSFYDRSRLLGEEAIPQMMSENTVTFLSTLLGASYREVMDRSQSNDDCFGFIPHTRMTLVPLGGSCADHSDSVVGLRVAYTGPDADSESQDQGTVFSVPALLGMYFTSLVEQVRSSYGEHNGHKDTNRFVLSFPLPHGHSPEAVRALKEACAIAGIAPSLAPTTSTPNGVPSTSMFITTTTESLARAYARKLSGLKPKEKTHLENGGKVLLVDMGCMQSTVMVLAVQPDLTSANVMACDSCASLGGFHFDLAIFHHLVKICEDKHKLKIVPGTKAALRFLTACERLRKLLSQLHEASVTIENLSDEVGDLTFTLRREELSSLCAPIMTRFKGLISNTLAAAGVGEAGGLAAVEVLGGGVRMQIIHEAILEFAGDLPLGAKLDDGSVAVGAALKAVPPPVLSVDEIAAKMTVSEEVDSVTETDNNTMKQDMKQDNSSNEEEVEARWGLSEEDLSAAVTAEKRMRVQDAEILRLLECRNEMEAYIFEMRGCSSQKHGDLIADPDALRATCDEFENWLWDFGETASLQEVVDKFSDLKEKLEGPEVGVEEPSTEGDVVVVVKRRQGGLCSEYLSVVAQDKAAVEKSLAEEAAQAAQEHEGEDKDDHDFRKLRKPERMRLVMKNKEEGTELFKGGNVRPAAARYQKALTHAAKFFDLSPEDTEEVNTVKLSLHLNLTQCYLKLENWDNATRHADEALAIDEQSVKALFRRAQAWEARKDYDKALADMKRAAELNAPKEDKLITKGMDRVKKLIQKEKDKEKKMWGKAFS